MIDVTLPAHNEDPSFEAVMTDDKTPMHITHSQFPWAGTGQLRPREATDDPIGRAMRIVLDWASYSPIGLLDVVAAAEGEVPTTFNYRERIEAAGQFFAYLTQGNLVKLWIVEDGYYVPARENPTKMWDRYAQARFASQPEETVAEEWACVLTLADHIQAAYDSGIWQSEPGWILNDQG